MKEMCDMCLQHFEEAEINRFQELDDENQPIEFLACQECSAEYEREREGCFKDIYPKKAYLVSA